MHPSYITAELKVRGLLAADVARTMQVSPVAIHNVIYGRSKSLRIARYISKSINTPLSQIWPGSYGQPSKTAKTRRKLQCR